MDSKHWVYPGIWCNVRQDMESVFHLQKCATKEKGNYNANYSSAAFTQRLFFSSRKVLQLIF